MSRHKFGSGPAHWTSNPARLARENDRRAAISASIKMRKSLGIDEGGRPRILHAPDCKDCDWVERKVLDARYGLGMSYREIAKSFGLKRMTVWRYCKKYGGQK